jgi:hypothetical protein
MNNILIISYHKKRVSPIKKRVFTGKLRSWGKDKGPMWDLISKRVWGWMMGWIYG